MPLPPSGLGPGTAREAIRVSAVDTGSQARDAPDGHGPLDGLGIEGDTHLVRFVLLPGLGLLGIELVNDRQRRQPAARQARYVANRARARGVLISTDGPDHNVLKIKPPLVFSSADADHLVRVLDEVLAEDGARPDAPTPAAQR